MHATVQLARNVWTDFSACFARRLILRVTKPGVIQGNVDYAASRRQSILTLRQSLPLYSVSFRMRVLKYMLAGLCLSLSDVLHEDGSWKDICNSK